MFGEHLLTAFLLVPPVPLGGEGRGNACHLVRGLLQTLLGGRFPTGSWRLIHIPHGQLEICIFV